MNSNRQIAILISFGTLLVAGCDQFKKPDDDGQIKRPAIADGEHHPPAHVEEETLPQIEAKTFFAAGRLFESQVAIHKAMQQYHRALQRDPDHVPALNRLGVLYARAGRHKEAERCLTRAVEIEPGSSFLRNNLGYEYMLQSRWRDAEAELRNALQLNRDFERARINLAMTLAKLNRFDESLVEFQRVLPEPDAYYNIGLMYRGKQRYRDAADAFHKALEFNPQFVAAETQLRQIQPRVSMLDATQPTLTDPERAVLAAERSDESTSVAPVVTVDDFAAAGEPIIDETLARGIADDQKIPVVESADSNPGATQIAETPCEEGDTQLAAIDDPNAIEAKTTTIATPGRPDRADEMVNDARILALHANIAGEMGPFAAPSPEPTAEELAAIAALSVPDEGMSVDIDRSPDTDAELAFAQSLEVFVPANSSIETVEYAFSPLAEADILALAAANSTLTDGFDVVGPQPALVTAANASQNDSSAQLLFRQAEPLMGPPLSAIAMYIEPKPEVGPSAPAAASRSTLAPVTVAKAPRLDQAILDNSTFNGRPQRFNRTSEFWTITELVDLSATPAGDLDRLLLPYLNEPVCDLIQFDIADLLAPSSTQTSARSGSERPDPRPVAFMTLDAPAEAPAAPQSLAKPAKGAFDDVTLASAVPDNSRNVPETNSSDSEPDSFVEWLAETISSYEPDASAGVNAASIAPAAPTSKQLAVAHSQTDMQVDPACQEGSAPSKQATAETAASIAFGFKRLDSRTHWHLVTYRLSEMWCSGSCSLVEFAEAMDVSGVSEHEAAIYTDQPEPPCLGGPLEDLAADGPASMASSKQ